jgi:hypothetical protein
MVAVHTLDPGRAATHGQLIGNKDSRERHAECAYMADCAFVPQAYAMMLDEIDG